MKKTVWVFSLIVMLLSQVFSPFAYAVTGEERSIEEPVVEKIVEKPEIVEENTDGILDPENPVEENVIEVNQEQLSWDNLSWSNTEITTGWTVQEETTEEKLGETEDTKVIIEDNMVVEAIEKWFLWETQYNSEEVRWTKEHKNVKVEVYAETWAFEETPTLVIEPLEPEKETEIKKVILDYTEDTDNLGEEEIEQIAEEKITEVVAFDIKFLNKEEIEVQPREWMVKVEFNYTENETLQETEEHEVKVYHLDDKDNIWNTIEEIKEMEVDEPEITENKKVETLEETNEEGQILTVVWDKFSIYTIVEQVKKEWPQAATEDQLANFVYWEISIARPDGLLSTDYPIEWFTIMDRNLWAINNDIASTGSYGYHYQWWNNYWLSQSDSAEDILLPITLEWNSLYENSGYYHTWFIQWDGPKSDVWPYPSNYQWVRWWSGDSASNNWWLDDLKSANRQWPCPSWWHVPSAGEWWLLVKYWAVWIWANYEEWLYGWLYNLTDNYTEFLEDFYLPMAERRYTSTATISLENEGFYWSSSPYTTISQNDSSFLLSVSSTKVNSNYLYGRASAFSVRCFKNTYTPHNQENIHTITFNFNWWKWSTAAIAVLSWEYATEPEEPIKEWYIFDGWYTGSGENDNWWDKFKFNNTNILWDLSLYAKWISEDEVAIFAPWKDFNKIIKSLVNGWIDEWIGTGTVDNNIISIVRYRWDINDIEYPKRLVSYPGVGQEVYAWYDSWVIYYYTNVGKVYLNEDASYMFCNLKGLISIDFNEFLTDKVVNMTSMFEEAFSSIDWLTLDFTSLDLSKVTNMSRMFYHMWYWTSNMNPNISNLTINFSNKDLSLVKDLSYLFYYAFYQWGTINNVTIDFSNVKIGNENWDSINAKSMFEGLWYNATNSISNVKVYFRNSKIRNVNNMEKMFYYFCYGYWTKSISWIEVDFSNSVFKWIWKLDNMFGYALAFSDSLSTVLIKFQNSSITDVSIMSYMFHDFWYGNSAIDWVEIDFKRSILTNIWNVWSMFDSVLSNSKSLTNVNIDFSETNFSIENMWRSFYSFWEGISNTGSFVNSVSIDFSQSNLSWVITMWNMFENAFKNQNSIKNIEINFFWTDLNTVTSMWNMFDHLWYNELNYWLSVSWLEINFSETNLSWVVSMEKMFYDAFMDGSYWAGWWITWVTIDFSKSVLKSSVDMNQMFSYAFYVNKSINWLLIDFSESNLKKVVNMKQMFNSFCYWYNNYGWTVINNVTIDFSKTDLKNVVNMEEMFYNAFSYAKSVSRISIDFSKWHMFENNDWIIIDFSDIDLSKVVTIKNMYKYVFKDVERLEWLNVDFTKTHFDSLIDMTEMFDHFGWGVDTVSWVNIDFSKTDLSNVRLIDSIFNSSFRDANTILWINVDFHQSIFSWVTSMQSAFDAFWYWAYADTISWVNINFSWVDLHNMRSMKKFFYQSFAYAKNINWINIDFENSDLRNVIDMKSAFDQFCYWANADVISWVNINFSKSNLSSIETMWKDIFENSFWYAGNLYWILIDFSEADMSRVLNMNKMFQSFAWWYGLKLANWVKIDFSKTRLLGVEDMSYMFNNAFHYVNQIKNSWIEWSWTIFSDTIKNLSNMFEESGLKWVDLSSFNTTNVTNMSSMFNWSVNMLWLDISNFDTRNVVDMNRMFQSNKKLKTIYAWNRFITNKVTSSDYIFYDNTNLIWWQWSVFNSSKRDISYAKIDWWVSNIWYFTDPSHFAIRFKKQNGDEITTQWIGIWWTAQALTWRYMNYSYYTGNDSDDEFDLATPLYAYTEIYASWVDAYEVKFYSWDELLYTEYVTWDNNSKLISIPENPVKEWYDFAWWCKNASCSSSNYDYYYNFDNSVTSDFNLYAYWEDPQQSHNWTTWCYSYSTSYTDWEYLATITQYNVGSQCNWVNVEIPNVIVRNWREYKVTSIGSSAFSQKLSWSLVLPQNLKTIWSSAFYGCSNLTSVEINDWLQIIWQFAFQNAWLTSLSIPNSVLSIENSAFQGNANMETLEIEDWMNELTIWNMAFMFDWIKELELPNSVRTLWTDAFNWCSSLESVIIWDWLTVLNTNIFANCTRLESVVIWDGVTTLWSSFNGDTNLKSITWWSNVETINWWAFDRAWLEEIEIPATVINISSSAFTNNPLTKVTFLWNNFTLWSSAFCSDTTDDVWSIIWVVSWATTEQINLLEAQDSTACLVLKKDKYELTYNAWVHSWKVDWLLITWVVVDYNWIVQLTWNGVKSAVSDKWYTFLWWTTNLNWTTPLESNTYIVTSDATLYPVFKKDSITKKIKFYKNWNKGYIYYWNNYTEDQEFTLCTIQERYNADEDISTCLENIEFPMWISESTPVTKWWTRNPEWDGIVYTWWEQKEILSEDSTIAFYLQMYAPEKVYKVSYEYWTGVEEWTIASWSCIIMKTINWNVQPENCEVALPELNVLIWYHTPLWYKKWEDTTYPENKIVLTWDEVLEAKAIPNNYTIVYKPWTWTWEIESQEFEYDKEDNLNKNKYIKNWYHFSWWLDALWKEYRDWEKVINLLTEWILELTAQWLQNPPAAWWWRTVTPAIKEQEHNTAEEKSQKEKEETVKPEKQIEVEQVPAKTNNSSTQTTQSSTQKELIEEERKIQSAYEWAYEHNITTISSLDDANPDWTVTRGHLAKMVVNYATNVLWREIPKKIPSYCSWNDWKTDRESEEIKDYAVKSCALWLMWLDMDKFLPNMEVTRAQFGTIMSRLLWWKKYAWWTPYYRKHLNALKENNIMTQLENPEKRVELRQWVWLMLMRSAENK